MSSNVFTIQDQICTVPIERDDHLANPILVAQNTPFLKFAVNPIELGGWLTAIDGQEVSEVKLDFHGETVNPSQESFQSALLQFELPEGFNWFGNGIEVVTVVATGTDQEITPNFDVNIVQVTKKVTQVGIVFHRQNQAEATINFRFKAIPDAPQPDGSQIVQVSYSQDPRIVVDKPKGT